MSRGESTLTSRSTDGTNTGRQTTASPSPATWRSTQQGSPAGPRQGAVRSGSLPLEHPFAPVELDLALDLGASVGLAPGVGVAEAVDAAAVLLLVELLALRDLDHALAAALLPPVVGPVGHALVAGGGPLAAGVDLLHVLPAGDAERARDEIEAVLGGTSLYAVLKGIAVVRENYEPERIEIAFRRRLKRQGLIAEEHGVEVPTGFGLLLFGEHPRDSFQQAGLLATVRYPNGKEEIRNFEDPYVLIPGLLEEWLRRTLSLTIDRSRRFLSRWSGKLLSTR